MELKRFKSKERFLSYLWIKYSIRVRTLRSHHIGQLISMLATVTRVTEVRPELIKAQFKCQLCGHEIEKSQVNRY